MDVYTYNISIYHTFATSQISPEPAMWACTLGLSGPVHARAVGVGRYLRATSTLACAPDSYVLTAVVYRRDRGRRGVAPSPHLPLSPLSRRIPCMPLHESY